LSLSALLPPGSPPADQAATNNKKEEFLPQEMLGTIQFYIIWFMYACGAGAGLMIISKLAAIVDKQAGITLGFVLVAILAIGNGAGRILAGVVSDKIGRKAMLLICFLSQALLIFLLSRTTQTSGANLSLFPSITKDFYGLKNFGMNYGLVFTAWGVGGFMLAKLAGAMYVKHQTFTFAYYGASGLLILAAMMVFLLKAPHHTIETAELKE